MKKLLLLIVFFTLPYFGFSQKQKEFYFIRNAEYGYGYTLPTNTGKELIETNGKFEAILYNSTDNSYQIKIFSENDFSRDQKDEEILTYYNSLLSGKHHEMGNIIITATIFKPEDYYFSIEGNKDGKDFMWKTYISEIPISGDLICNTIIFYYSKSKKNKNLGKKLIAEFGSL